MAVCAAESAGQRQSRASSNTPMLSDTMISTECQEQQQLMGSLCVRFDVSMPSAACLHVRAHWPHQKQRNPNTHPCISINITGCQSTSNNAAVIYDNTNRSSCGEPREKAPSLLCSDHYSYWLNSRPDCTLFAFRRCGSVACQAVRTCKHHKTPNPRGLCSASALKGFCLSSIIPVVRPPCRQGADLHVLPLHHTYSLAHTHTRFQSLIFAKWMYSISYFRRHLVLIYRSREGALIQARLNICQSRHKQD